MSSTRVRRGGFHMGSSTSSLCRIEELSSKFRVPHHFTLPLRAMAVSHVQTRGEHIILMPQYDVDPSNVAMT